MTEPATEAGRRLLDGMPWTNERERETWARLILAIEQEARADLAARIIAAVEGLPKFRRMERDGIHSIAYVEDEAVLDAIREASDEPRA